VQDNATRPPAPPQPADAKRTDETPSLQKPSEVARNPAGGRNAPDTPGRGGAGPAPTTRPSGAVAADPSPGAIRRATPAPAARPAAPLTPRPATNPADQAGTAIAPAGVPFGTPQTRPSTGAPPVLRSAVQSEDVGPPAPPAAASPDAGQQLVAQQPTTGPTDPAALADHDEPLDVVIVLQRAPVPSQGSDTGNTQAQQREGPAEAAPAAPNAAQQTPAQQQK
jgi:hypothetical protein